MTKRIPTGTTLALEVASIPNRIGRARLFRRARAFLRGYHVLSRDSKPAPPSGCAASAGAGILRATDRSSGVCRSGSCLLLEQPVDRDTTRSSDRQPQKQCQILSLVKPQQSFE